MRHNVSPITFRLNACNNLPCLFGSSKATAIVGVGVAAKVTHLDVETTIALIEKNRAIDVAARHVVAEGVGVERHREAPCWQGRLIPTT